MQGYSIPGLGRSNMPWSNETLVPQVLKPVLPRAHAVQQEKPPHWGAHTLQLESRPHSLQLEKVLSTTETQHSQKKKKINKLINFKNRKK